MRTSFKYISFVRSQLPNLNVPLFFSYFGHSQTSTEVVRGRLQAMQATTLNLNLYMKY